MSAANLEYSCSSWAITPTTSARIEGILFSYAYYTIRTISFYRLALY